MLVISPLIRHNVTVLNNDAGGPALLFGNGFGTDQSAWNSIREAFPESRIILFDNAGSGTTDPEYYSSHRYSQLESYAEDLLSICNELDLNQVIYIGHSVGGMIGLLAAKAQPERFSKMVFIGASPRYQNEEGYTGGFEAEDLEGLFDSMKSNYYAWASGFSQVVMQNPEVPKLAETFAKTLTDIRPDIALSVAKVIFKSDYRTALSDFNHPVLLVQAHADIAVPMQVAEYLNKNIINSQLVVVNAFGHLPHISAPNEIIKAIKAFI